MFAAIYKKGLDNKELSYLVTMGTSYLVDILDDVVLFSKYLNDAMLFETEEDAEKMINILKSDFGFEHVFCTFCAVDKDNLSFQ